MLACLMRVIAIGTLREFWRKHADAAVPLRAWFAEASRAQWRTPGETKASHRNASFLANNRVVFNVKSNEYRLVVAVHYKRGLIFVRFVGTHREYDRIDAVTE
jgi:mRNA interferase HigB